MRLLKRWLGRISRSIRIRAFLRRPLSPILFAAYAVLALLAHNIDQVEFTVAWRALSLSIVGSIVLLFGLRFLLRNWQRAGIMCTLSVILFFSYGHVHNYLREADFFGMVIGRHRYILPFWLGIFALGLWWTVRSSHSLGSVTVALNLIGAVVLTFPVYQILGFEIRSRRAFIEAQYFQPETHDLQSLGDQPPPDIYYIILDAYTRDDILMEVYQYDNTPFLDSLREIGFYIPRCSQSNYTQTDLSLASTLNMNYLEALGDGFVSESTDRSGLWPLLLHSEVRRTLENFGYTIVAFDTSFSRIIWKDADIYLSPSIGGRLTTLLFSSGLNGFEAMIFKTSAGLVLSDAAKSIHLIERLLPDMDYPNIRAREKTLYVLDQLSFKRVPTIRGPKFVYAHIISPHPPYVFGPDGEFVGNDSSGGGYINQLIYTNKRVEALVRDIIEKSEIPPIIIIQGDHGLRWYPHERMAILNAYYLPGTGEQMLYPTISPVNTFRIIFDHYFKGDFGLLEDISYYSGCDAPYDYEVVSNPRIGCEVDRGAPLP